MTCKEITWSVLDNTTQNDVAAYFLSNNLRYLSIMNSNSYSFYSFEMCHICGNFNH